MSSHPLHTHIARELKTLRQARGISVHQMARRLRVDRKAVYQVEDASRSREFHLQTIINYAEALGADLHIEFREKQDERVAAMEGK